MKRLLSVLLLLSLAAVGVVTMLWQRAEDRRVDSVAWTRFVMDSLGTSVRLPAPLVWPATVVRLARQ